MALILHDIECDIHGYLEDALVDSSSISAGTLPCPDADDGHYCRVVYNKVARAVGILPTNPEVSKQLGITFETNAQKREYMKANPHIIEFSKGDSLDRQIGQRSAERADKSARAWGYRGEGHRREEIASAKSKGWEPMNRKPSPKQT